MTSPRFAPHPHRQHWDTRYGEAYRERPASSLLARWLPQMHPGTALDLACGTGRNAVFLAGHGWRVVGIDISPVGLHLAQQAAQKHQVTLDLVAVNIDDWPLPPAYFDLICVFRFLDRALCPRLVAALRPDGMLLYETFTIGQRNFEGGPRSDALLLQPDELPTLFPTLRQVEYNEGIIEEDGRPRALAGYVGRKEAEE